MIFLIIISSVSQFHANTHHYRRIRVPKPHISGFGSSIFGYLYDFFKVECTEDKIWHKMRENLVFQLFFNPFLEIKFFSGSTYPKLHFSGTRIYHYPTSPFLVLLPNLHRIQDVMSLKWQINFYGICTHWSIFHSKYARFFHTFGIIIDNNVAVFCMMAR